MFHKKKTSPQKGTAILSATTLLADERCAASIDAILALLPFDTQCSDTCTTGLLHAFARYCQQLPDPTNTLYQLPSGLLLRALDRTVAALELFNHYIAQETLSLMDEESKIWLYAVFSAALLQGIGKLVTDYTIDILDKNEIRSTWNPLLGSFPAEARYYNYALKPNNDEAYQRNLHPLLAKAIMPVEGYAWIASNNDVFRVWLALLHEDWESAGTFGAILVHSEALGLQRGIKRYIESNPINTNNPHNVLPSTFINIEKTHTATNNDKAIGALFIEWLQNALTTNDITWKEISRGKDVIITQAIFEQFAKKNTLVKNWHMAERGLLALNVHRENKQKQGIILQNGILAAPLPERKIPSLTLSGTF